MPRRRAYFGFFVDAAKHPGGASFAGFLENMRKDAEDKLTVAEKHSLAALLGQSLVTPLPDDVQPPAGPGRAWTHAEAVAVVGKRLRGRDFAKFIVLGIGLIGFAAQQLTRRAIDALGLEGAVLANPIGDAAIFLPPVAAQRITTEALEYVERVFGAAPSSWIPPGWSAIEVRSKPYLGWIPLGGEARSETGSSSD